MNNLKRDRAVASSRWCTAWMTLGLIWAITPTYAESPTLSVQQAIDKALAQSPSLASAKAALDASQGAALQAHALPNPELGFSAENIAGSGAYKATDAGELTYSLSQKIEVGKRPARRHMASADMQTAAANLKSQQLDIIRDVKIAYANVLAAEENVELAGKQESLAHDILANVSKRVKAARDPLIYQSQAEISLVTAKLAQDQARRQLLQARKRLAVLWGGEPLNQPLDKSWLTSQTSPANLESYQTQLAENPDLTRFKSMKLAKQEAVILEKAQTIPDPTVNVGLRTFRESDERAMVIGVSMPIPVFNRNQGNIQTARAEVNQIENDAAGAYLAAEQNLAEAWQEWDLASQEAVQLSSQVIPAAQKTYTLAREGYDRGRFAYLEILNAQSTLSQAQGQHIQALLRQVTAKAQVERLTGATSHPSLNTLHGKTD